MTTTRAATQMVGRRRVVVSGASRRKTTSTNLPSVAGMKECRRHRHHRRHRHPGMDAYPRRRLIRLLWSSSPRPPSSCPKGWVRVRAEAFTGCLEESEAGPGGRTTRDRRGRMRRAWRAPWSAGPRACSPARRLRSPALLEHTAGTQPLLAAPREAPPAAWLAVSQVRVQVQVRVR